MLAFLDEITHRKARPAFVLHQLSSKYDYLIEKEFLMPYLNIVTRR
jgi:hypothetical protein